MCDTFHKRRSDIVHFFSHQYFKILAEALTGVSVSLTKRENIYSEQGKGLKINKTLSMLVQKTSEVPLCRIPPSGTCKNFLCKIKPKKSKPHPTPILSLQEGVQSNPPTVCMTPSDRIFPSTCAIPPGGWQGFLCQLPPWLPCSFETADLFGLAFLVTYLPFPVVQEET